MTDDVWQAVSDVYEEWCKVPIGEEVIEPIDLRLAIEALIEAWDEFLG